MEAWLIQLVEQHAYSFYAIVIVLAIIEGPVLSMACGVLLKLQIINFLPIYASLMIGDLLGDSLWYYVGYRFGHPFIRRFGKYFSITEEEVAKMTALFRKYNGSILFISKVSNGFTFAVVILMTAGMVKIPFLRFFFINLSGQFIWTGLLLATGYFFGHAYVTVDNIFGKISIVTLFVILLFAFNGYKKYVARRTEKMTI